MPYKTLGIRVHQQRIATKKLELEITEWQEIKARLELVEQAQAFHTPSEASDFRKAMAEVKQLMKEMA